MGKLKIVPIVTAIACGMGANAPALAECVKQSPQHTVGLIELYTSEGCSSCPAADRWVSAIGAAGLGPDRVIPLSLHVDYWDSLGWKDRFASPQFTRRQQSLAAYAGTGAVYTPGVFLNLREFRGWYSDTAFRQAVEKINAQPAAADIRLELKRGAASQLALIASFKVKGAALPKRAQAFIALYENRLQTQVKAGENGGATLNHDYVVRAWLGPIEIGAGAAEFQKTIALDPAWNPDNLGVAALIQDSGSGELLQATALPACS